MQQGRLQVLNKEIFWRQTLVINYYMKARIDINLIIIRKIKLTDGVRKGRVESIDINGCGDPPNEIDNVIGTSIL